MIAVLRFVLECCLVAVAAGAVTSIAVGLVHRVARRRIASVTPSRRADLTLAMALLPGATALAVTIAAAAPSLLAASGLHHDHCHSHAHHAHVCLLHAFDVPLSRTVSGALGLAVLVFAAVRFGGALVKEWRALRGLARLATPRRYGSFVVDSVPGAPRLCHAVGVVRRRVLLSEQLANEVSEEQLEAALAHEAAHHGRRDGLATLLVRLSAIFSAPFVLRAVHADHRLAMEEASDARAAAAVGDPRTVADAIVAIARVQIRGAVPSLGITGAVIERRVLRLLSREPDRPSVGVVGVLALVSAPLVVVLLGSWTVHHAVENLLHLL